MGFENEKAAVLLADQINNTLRRVREHRDEALRVLQAVEFCARGKCPVCAGWNCSDAGETDGKHTKDCALNKVLQGQP